MSSNSLTPSWYYQMPQWFRDAHPLAPGGGLRAPPRSYAPMIESNPSSDGQNRSGDEFQINTLRQRSTSQNRGNRNINPNQSDTLTPPWYWQMPQLFRDAHPLAPGGGLLSPGRSDAPTPSGQTPSEDILTPPWYWNMPKEWRDGHPLAPGGGILSPGRSYAPPPPDYVGPSIEMIMLERNNRRLKSYQRHQEMLERQHREKSFNTSNK